MGRTGRRPGATGTRERIAIAATRAFAEAGFDGASIRGIAREAGVDPALVHHYFGSKEHLFVETMDLPFDPQQLARAIVAGGVDGVGERIMQFAIGVWEQPGLRLITQGIARSVVGDPRAGGTVRHLLEATLLPAIRELGVDHPELRAELVWSQVIGIVLGRFVVGMSPLAEASADDLVAIVAPALQATLTSPMPVAGSSIEVLSAR
jgi:AcrR family transcriptional regulator